MKLWVLRTLLKILQKKIIFSSVYFLYQKLKPHHIQRIERRLSKAGITITPKSIWKKTLFNLQTCILELSQGDIQFDFELDKHKVCAKELADGVYFSIHSGPYELLPEFLNQTLQSKICVPFEKRHIPKWLHQLRAQNGVCYYPHQESAHYWKKLLKKQATLALLIDQNPAPGKSFPIAGQKIELHTSILEKALQKGIPVYWFEIISDKSNKEKSYLVQIKKAPANAEALNDFIIQCVNDCIYARPKDWIWHYPKANTQ